MLIYKELLHINKKIKRNNSIHSAQRTTCTSDKKIQKATECKKKKEFCLVEVEVEG